MNFDRPAITTPTKAQKRLRKRLRGQQPPSQHQDGSLTLTFTALTDAITALCSPQPQHLDGKTIWLDSRYQQLRDSLYGTRGASGNRNTPSSLMPMWIDALGLLLRIDHRTAELDASLDTPTRLHHVQTHPWRPGDCEYMQTITTEITAWVKAINDLFSPKPIFLPDNCPHCKQSHTYRWMDDGERVRSPALMITAEAGAICLSCKDTWPPDRLVFLGKLLGYKPPEGVVTT